MGDLAVVPVTAARIPVCEQVWLVMRTTGWHPAHKCAPMFPMRNRSFHGEKLRELRLAAGEDIHNFADAIDYSWRHIQMIETWGRQPSNKLVRRILGRLSELHGRTIDVDEVSTPADQLQVAA